MIRRRTATKLIQFSQQIQRGKVYMWGEWRMSRIRFCCFQHSMFHVERTCRA